MIITSINTEPVAEIPSIEPRARGATAPGCVPVLVGGVRGLSPELSGIVLASDLQAREVEGTNRHIGVVVAERVAAIARARGVAPERVGVILAGDLHTSDGLQRRFGVGDVTPVWDAFAQGFRWVTGVLGNVDRLPRKSRKRHRVLEANIENVDSLAVGGVGGIIGPAKMENRRPESEFVSDVRRVVDRSPDVLVLHEGPSVPGQGLRGSDSVRKALGEYSGLVVCGHNRWPIALTTLRQASVLNTDGRCVLLLAR